MSESVFQMNNNNNITLPQVATAGSSDLLAANAASMANATNYKKALHQAILYKARTNPSENSMCNLNSSMFNCTMPSLKLNQESSNKGLSQQHQVKWTNLNGNSSSSSLCINLNTPMTASSGVASPFSISSIKSLANENDNTDLLSVATSQLFSQLNDELNANLPVIATSNNNNNNSSSNNNSNSNYNDELDSPLNIKENILTSIRNLKHTLLDPLRSSSSDDEDTQTEKSNNEANTTIDTQSNDIIVIGSILPSVNNGIVKLAIPIKSGYKVANSNNINIPKLPNTVNQHTISNIAHVPLKSMNISSMSLLSSQPNNLNTQLACLKTNTRIANGKRVKEEALSNSSSSDEDDLHQQRHKQQQHQEQSAIMPSIATSKPFVHSRNNPKITQVVSAAASAAATAVSTALQLSFNVNSSGESSLSSISSSSTSPCSSSYMNSSSERESELVSSPVSFSSCSYSSKSSQKSNMSSIDLPDLSCSWIASPTSSSNGANNDSAIDLQDDNSSTASGPIYVRQPGFEHHAHEIQMSSNGDNLLVVPSAIDTSNSHCAINSVNQKMSKKSEKTISFLTNSVNNTAKVNTKAKKKMCLMVSDPLLTKASQG